MTQLEFTHKLNEVSQMHSLKSELQHIGIMVDLACNMRNPDVIQDLRTTLSDTKAIIADVLSRSFPEEVPASN